MSPSVWTKARKSFKGGKFEMPMSGDHSICLCAGCILRGLSWTHMPPRCTVAARRPQTCVGAVRLSPRRRRQQPSPQTLRLGRLITPPDCLATLQGSCCGPDKRGWPCMAAAWRPRSPGAFPLSGGRTRTCARQSRSRYNLRPARDATRLPPPPSLASAAARRQARAASGTHQHFALLQLFPAEAHPGAHAGTVGLAEALALLPCCRAMRQPAPWLWASSPPS